MKISSKFQIDRRKTDELWEKFVAKEDTDDGQNPLACAMIGEWQRCRNLGVDPFKQFAVKLPDEEYARIAQEKSWITEAARPILDKTANLLSHVPGSLIFTDSLGVVLHLAGDSRTRVKLADGINLVEGSQWAESVAGNNGMGTAIQKRAPVLVFASEHFCQGWQGYTCAASPVFDPLTGDLIGVVDYSISVKGYRDDALALTYSLAGNVTADLRLTLDVARMNLIREYTDHSSRFPSDGVIVVDHGGRVVRSTPGIDPETIASAEKGDSAIVSDPPLHTHVIRLSDQRIGTIFVVRLRKTPRYSRPTTLQPPREIRSFGQFVTTSDQVTQVLARVDRIIPTNLTVLLVGETGTGKELVASYIHAHSNRRSGPFVAVNCGAISKELFESAFFGYERGAFTGADPRGRKGFFESANGGTLFLDEIGELPLAIQAALLRVLETGKFRRSGSEREITTDCRIIAATNRSLWSETDEGKFRRDLYFRLNVANFVIPPLREHPEDIAMLTDVIVKRFCEKAVIPPKAFSAEALQALSEYSWPGNVRELRNVVESAIVCAGDTVDVRDLPGEILKNRQPEPAPQLPPKPLSHPHQDRKGFNIRDNERMLIHAALQEFRSINRAARSLDISRSTLYRKLKSLNIDPKIFNTGEE